MSSTHEENTCSVSDPLIGTAVLGKDYVGGIFQGENEALMEGENRAWVSDLPTAWGEIRTVSALAALSHSISCHAGPLQCPAGTLYQTEFFYLIPEGVIRNIQ